MGSSTFQLQVCSRNKEERRFMFINLRTSLSGFHGNGRRTRRGGKRV